MPDSTRVSNVNRKAAAKTVNAALQTLLKTIGLSIQTHRAYESSSRGSRGLRQEEVATHAGTSQSAISTLENGTAIPEDDTILEAILEKCGFDMQPGMGGEALFNVLKALRDNKNGMKLIDKQLPR